MDDLRHPKSETLFIIGLVSLISGFSLLLFSLYLVPNLLFGWHYSLPDFFMNWSNWMQYSFNYSDDGASKMLLLICFVVSIVLVLIAYLTSIMMDKQLYVQNNTDELQPKKDKKLSHEGLDLGLKLFVIIIFVFILAAVFEWIIYTPPSQSMSSSTQFLPNTQLQHVDNS